MPDGRNRDRFNLVLDPEVRRELRLLAVQRGVTMARLVDEALRREIARLSETREKSA